MLDLTDQTYPKYLQTETVPIVLHIWSTSYENNQQIDAVLEVLQSDYGEKVHFTRIHAEENPEVLASYNVNHFPCILFFQYNKLEYRVVRPMPRWQIGGIIDRILGEFG